MSDTYFIKNLKCAYCAEENDFEEESAQFGCPGLPYTFEFRGEFVCKGCKKKNEIVMEFVAVKRKTPEDDLSMKGGDKGAVPPVPPPVLGIQRKRKRI